MVVLPAALRRRSDREAIREDIEPYVGTSLVERAELLDALCRFAAEQIANHPRGAEILDYQDPRSAASLRTWGDLVARSRRK
jgi:hypothetical protein